MAIMAGRTSARAGRQSCGRHAVGAECMDESKGRTGDCCGTAIALVAAHLPSVRARVLISHGKAEMQPEATPMWLPLLVVERAARDGAVRMNSGEPGTHMSARCQVTRRRSRRTSRPENCRSEMRRTQ